MGTHADELKQSESAPKAPHYVPPELVIQSSPDVPQIQPATASRDPGAASAQSEQESTVSTAQRQLEEHCATLPLLDSDIPENFPKMPPQYELLQRIGRGGMGIIFKARHRFTGAQLAIKFLHANLVQDAEARKRFLFEAKTAMYLKHANIIQVHDFGISEGSVPYLVMDWIDGISLARKIERDGALNIDEALRIGMQTADALSYAHTQKFIHRDLKPENLMLTRDHEGRTSVRILDFGIAKALAGNESTCESQSMTQTGAIIGSPIYMSPEQGLGRTTDERSDIYSLGCVLYYALLGHPPFYGANSVETICKHINDPVPPMQADYRSFPDTLQNIILRTLEKEPRDRYQSMQELGHDLELFKSGQIVQVKALSDERRSNKMMLHILKMFAAGYAITYSASMLWNYVFNR